MNEPLGIEYLGEQLRELAWPMGGIGTGCVSLEGRGTLRDWEIFGRPHKGLLLEPCFAALWVQEEGAPPQTRLLHAPRISGHVGDGAEFWGYGHGRMFASMDGLPCFEQAVFRHAFPFARIELLHPRCPLEVSLEAFSPFIPLDERSSGLPVASFTYKLRNNTGSRVEAVVAMSMGNPVGLPHPVDEKQERARNQLREGSACRGVAFSNERFAPGDEGYGTVVLATDWEGAMVCERWKLGAWWDPVQDFWNRFRETGVVQTQGPDEPGPRRAASLGLRVVLEPGEEAELPFLLAWCFPNAVKYWGDESQGKGATWTRWYASQWPTAWDAATEFFSRKEELRSRSLAFSQALYSSTLPEEVIESVAATATTLRTPTCDRLPDGTFWAWEGCSSRAGCCDGSCSHVWNYALSHAFLFPNLQASMLGSHLRQGFNCGPAGTQGAMNFRIPLPLGSQSPLWHAASDGQLGLLVQLYRHWRQTGDERYLADHWPLAKLAMEYAWVMWDRDRDGLVEGDMHNTYDINFQGPNPLTQFFYLAALRACTEMAEHLGEDSTKYRELFRAGSALAVERLWNGKWFVQTLDCLAPDAPQYQHGVGCLSDQLFGQLASHVAGLGYLADPEKIAQALDAVFLHNFLDPLDDHECLQRVYAVGDESGLILCTWPDGGRPEFPFPYSDEVWSGIEYQVATALAYEGRVDEALRIARAVRARHDGKRRNPFNEFECGSHYARALASYGLVLALSGFTWDAVSGEWSLQPRFGEDQPFRSFYCTPQGWGLAHCEDGHSWLEQIGGPPAEG